MHKDDQSQASSIGCPQVEVSRWSLRWLHGDGGGAQTVPSAVVTVQCLVTRRIEKRGIDSQENHKQRVASERWEGTFGVVKQTARQDGNIWGL